MAAGDNVVSIVFEGDTSSMTTAFAKVESELKAVSSGTVDWTRLTKESAGAQEFMRGAVGKTAADFKPATAAMREASVAVEDLGKKGASGLGAFRGSMRALRFDIFEVVAALGLMVKAVDEAAKAEASQRHARDQGISNVSVIKLEGAAREEKFEPGQYDDAAVALKVAGVSADNLVQDVTELGKASRISGVPFKELVSTAAEMTDEFESGGVPSLAQMTTLTLASSGATQGLTDEYRELSRTLKVTEEGWKVQEQAQARTHKETQEHTSALDSFAGKTGVAADAFTAFKAKTNYAGGIGTNMMGAEVMKQYGEGLKQLSQETGMGTEQIRTYMASGKVGYEDLISASGRYRTHQQEEIEFTQKQRDEKLKLDTEAKQRALGLSALQSVMSQSDWKDKAADLQKLSPEGMEQQMQAQLTGAMKTLGDAIVKWFPEIKAAMIFLAGVEILSRAAAINARFFPNAFKSAGSAAGSAVAETGEAVVGGGTALGLGATLATVGAMAAIPIGGAFLAKTLADKSGNAFKDSGGYYKDPTSLDDGGTADVAPYTQEAARQQMLGTPTPAATAPSSNGPTTVADPKMHELVTQLLKVFAGT